jgi:heterotetrameric sarcosine oxidase gamma subunit
MPPLTVVDWSDTLVAIHVSGSGSTAVLARQCTLDLAANAFDIGQCARTRMAGVPVIIERLEAERFTCHVLRSHRNYIQRILQEALYGMSL